LKILSMTCVLRVMGNLSKCRGEAASTDGVPQAALSCMNELSGGAMLISVIVVILSKFAKVVSR
jgi:hypothetical protein